MKMSRPKLVDALILTTALIPPLAIQFEFGSAAGVMAVAIISFLAVRMKGRLHRGSSTSVTQVAMGVGLTLFYLLSSGIVSWVVNSTFEFGRFFQSLILMFFCLIGAYEFSAFVNSCTEEKVDKALRFVFMVILFSSVARILGIHLSGDRTVFFYNEPSHYALGLAPFLLYMVVSDAKHRWIWMLLAFVVGLLIKSLTLIIVVLLVFGVVLRISIKEILFILMLTVVASLAGGDLAYYFDRVALASDSENFSNLVYLSGWERALLSMHETWGLGYGLNQLGIVGSQGDVMRTLADMGAEGLNALDGGAVAPKLIAEFGAMGLFLLMIYARYFLKGLRFVRCAMRETSSVSRIEVFFWSCVIMYSIDFFVRGSGYFTAESFMFIGAIWGLAQRTRRRKGKFVAPPPFSSLPAIRKHNEASVHAK